MDPVLSWVVCLLSAFLLAAGGFLMARARSSRRLARRLEDAAQLKMTLRQALAERDEARSRVGELDAKLTAQEASIAAHFEAMDRDGFGGPTELPDPHSYFDRQHPSVPRLEQLGEGEFEISAAAPPSAREAVDAHEDALDPHDQTKQFNLHSPEAVVQFMQRIDELTDENRELHALLEDQEVEIKEKRAEGSEQVHRAAALDATNDKLRVQVKRLNERLRQLEEQLDGESAQRRESPGFVPAVTVPGAPPPMSSAGATGVPPLPPTSTFQRAGRPPRIPPGLAGPNDGPTLQVPKMSTEELGDGNPEDAK